MTKDLARLVLLILLAATAGRASEPAADRQGAAASIYGFEYGDYLKIKTIEDLLKLDENRPDQGYSFDPSYPTQRLDAGLFDPYLDTSAAKNNSIDWRPGSGTSPEQGLSPICFGLATATARWWQQQVAPQLEPVESDELQIGPDAQRLRTTLEVSKNQRVQFLREARDHQDQDIAVVQGFRKLDPTAPSTFQWKLASDPERFFKQHLLKDLSDPKIGATDLGISMNQGINTPSRKRFHHAVLAYGLLEGVATAPNGHRVRAIRIEIWDSNFPRESANEAADSRDEDYLLYFPRARRFGIGRDSVWRRGYTYDRLPQARPTDRQAIKALFDVGRFLQQDGPTFLANDQVKMVQINDEAANRRRLAANEAYGSRSVERYHEEVHQQLVSREAQEQLTFLTSLRAVDPQISGGTPSRPLSWAAYRPPVIDDSKVTAEIDRRLHRAMFEEKTKELH